MSSESLIERIAAELRSREPQRAEPGSYDVEAAVALMLRPAGPGLEFLAIKRPEHDRDPWSGHMALPGGRREEGDESLWQTAVRETREEIGVDLEGAGRLLGQLDDVHPRTRRIPAIAITPYVVAVGPDVAARTSSEVEYAVWVPLQVVVDEGARGTLVHDALPDREFATIEYDGHVIWGLTLRILSQVEELLGRIGYGGKGA
ncbi:MAG: CoA pyrophosphatase [Gemmatimonadota bacterium]|nr:MAG: CoA pyrophosphatase [Gemmatimonadota bacterium]